MSQEKHEQEAKNRIENLNLLLNQVGENIETTINTLQKLIEFDTAELCLFRQLEEAIRNKDVTAELTTRILDDLSELRKEIQEYQEGVFDGRVYPG